MRESNQKYEIKVDTYTRVCLTVIAVLLTVLILGLWAETPITDQAQAQAKGPFVDSSTQSQLIAVVKAQDKTTAKLSELITVLKSGQVKVQLTDAGRPSAPAKGATNAPVSKKTK